MVRIQVKGTAWKTHNLIFGHWGSVVFLFYPSFLRHSVNGFLGVMANGTENAFHGRRTNARYFLLAGKAVHYPHFCSFVLACSWLKLCPKVGTQEVPWWIPHRGELPGVAWQAFRWKGLETPVNLYWMHEEHSVPVLETAMILILSFCGILPHL